MQTQNDYVAFMRKKATKIRLDAEVLDSLRDAVAFIGRGITVTGIVEDAVTKEVERLEKEHGGPFPEADPNSSLRESGKEPIVIRMPEGIMDRLRNAAGYFEKTISNLVHDGVESELKDMQKSFNKGKKFPRRPES